MVRTLPRRAWVRSLVQELNSCKLSGTAKKKKKIYIYIYIYIFFNGAIIDIEHCMRLHCNYYNFIHNDLYIQLHIAVWLLPQFGAPPLHYIIITSFLVVNKNINIFTIKGHQCLVPLSDPQVLMAWLQSGAGALMFVLTKFLDNSY